MIAPSVDSPPWPLYRWVTFGLLVLGGQIFLIFWLADRKPETSRVIVSTPIVYIPSTPQEELPDVINPALFVLANRHGFSGEAWLEVLPPSPPPPPSPPDRAPPPLAHPVLQLGTALTVFLRTNLAGVFDLAPKPDLQLDTISPTETVRAEQSTVTMEGNLANRPLLSQFKLDSWPSTENAEILTNSVVQVGVDPEGHVFSAVLVPPTGSGSKDADASALTLAKSARFKPLRRIDGAAAGNPSLGWGSLVFHWHTITPPATNAPPVNQ